MAQRVRAASEPADRSDRRERQTIRLQPTRGFSRVSSGKELWRYRDVGVQIAARDVTVRYRQTALGAAWAVLQPVATMVVFSLFFGRIAGLSSDGVPYPVFSLAALVPWTFFSTALLLGSTSMVTNAPLVSKIYFPRIFIPAGVIAAGLVDLAISLVILFIIVLAYGIVPSVKLLVLPLLIAITVAAALGVSSALSAVNVRYRDVQYMVPVAIQLWLFATPVAYTSTHLRNPWRTVLGLNPMAGVVEGFRWSVLGVSNDPWAMIAVSSVSAIVLLVGGLAYFARVERRFADIM